MCSRSSDSCSRSARIPRSATCFGTFPLYGGERLQNRNIVITDLALAVLVAYWADRLATDRASVSATPDEQSPKHRAAARSTAHLSAWHVRPAHFPRSRSS